MGQGSRSTHKKNGAKNGAESVLPQDCDSLGKLKHVVLLTSASHAQMQTAPILSKNNLQQTAQRRVHAMQQMLNWFQRFNHSRNFVVNNGALRSILGMKRQSQPGVQGSPGRGTDAP
jgi:hypothetical protein